VPVLGIIVVLDLNVSLELVRVGGVLRRLIWIHRILSELVSKLLMPWFAHNLWPTCNSCWPWIIPFQLVVHNVLRGWFLPATVHTMGAPVTSKHSRLHNICAARRPLPCEGGCRADRLPGPVQETLRPGRTKTIVIFFYHKLWGNSPTTKLYFKIKSTYKLGVQEKEKRKTYLLHQIT
jgi:hypothetical protein